MNRTPLAYIVFLAFLVLIAFLFVSRAWPAEVEVSASYGWPLGSDKVTSSSVAARVGKDVTPRLFVGLEVELSHLSFHEGGSANAVALGPVVKFDWLRVERVDFYVEGSVGIALASGSPDEKLLGHNPLGSIKAGTGVDIDLGGNFLVNIGARYSHLSSHNPADTGVNFLGIIAGIIFKW